jgi:hypothetical protein
MRFSVHTLTHSSTSAFATSAPIRDCEREATAAAVRAGPADALCCRTAGHHSGTMGARRLFGPVRGHVRLLRRWIPTQAIISLRGSRQALLGLSRNRRNKHTDDKAQDRKILHRTTPLLDVERSTEWKIWLTQRSVILVDMVILLVLKPEAASADWIGERSVYFRTRVRMEYDRYKPSCTVEVCGSHHRHF